MPRRSTALRTRSTDEVSPRPHYGVSSVGGAREPAAAGRICVPAWPASPPPTTNRSGSLHPSFVGVARRFPANALVTCNMGAWLAYDSGYANTASGYARRGFDLSRFGCPTYGRRNLSRKLTASRLPSPPASMRPTTKRSSMRSPSTGPPLRGSPPSEARRYSHRCRTRCLLRYAKTCCHRSGRSVRCDGLSHSLSTDNRPRRGATYPNRCEADGGDRN